MKDGYSYYKIQVTAYRRVRCIKAKSFEDAVRIFREQPFAFIKADVFFAGRAKTIEDFNADRFIVESLFESAEDSMFTPRDTQVNYRKLPTRGFPSDKK